MINHCVGALWPSLPLRHKTNRYYYWKKSGGLTSLKTPISLHVIYKHFVNDYDQHNIEGKQAMRKNPLGVENQTLWWMLVDVLIITYQSEL